MLSFNKIVIGFSFIGLLSRRALSTTASVKMSEESNYVSGTNSIVYVTTPNQDTAKQIAHLLIEKNLAACVNVIPEIMSVYKWEGKINEDSELLLMIKTTTDKVSELSKFVRDIHPYSVPEVISVKIEDGNPAYLNWISSTVNNPKK